MRASDKDTEFLALASQDIKCGAICRVKIDVDTGHAWVEPASQTALSRLLKKVTDKMEEQL